MFSLCLVWFVLPDIALPASPGPFALDTVYTINEIVVNATRSTTAGFSLPLAISIVEGSRLNRSRGLGLDEALALTPGVVAQSRYGTQDIRLSVRGFGARGAGQRSNAGTSRGLRILSDGFPETEPDGRTSFDLVDFSSLGRIEVIRSNSSALWGNAAGGVINLVSDTWFNRPFAAVQTTVGSFGFVRENVRAGAILSSGRIIFSMSNTSFGGWRAHSRSRSTIARIGIESQLSQQSLLWLSLVAGANSFQIPGPLTRAQFDADPSQAQDDPANYSPTFVQRNERRFNRLGRIGASFTHAFSDDNSLNVSAFVNPKYLQRSERNTFRDFTRYHIGGSIVESFTIRPSSSLGLTTILGGDAALQDGAILFYSLKNGERGTLQTDKNERASTAGAFVQEDIAIGPRLGISAGLRFDDVTYTNRINYDSNPAAKLLKEEKSFTRATPKAGLTYRIQPTISLYANLGGGIEVPAGNETDPSGTFGQDTVYAINPLIDASTSTTFELGAKGKLDTDIAFLRRLDFDIAAYWVSVKNDFVPYRGGRFYFSAGKSRRTGLETGVTIACNGGIIVSGSLTLSRNEYLEYIIDSVYYGGQGRKDLAHNRIPGIPDLVYGLSFRYAPDWMKGWYVEATVKGMGRYFADDGNAYDIPAYSTVDLQAGVADLLLWESLSLRGFLDISNLADSRYAASAWINPDLSTIRQPVYLEPGLPRTVTASLGIEWKF